MRKSNTQLLDADDTSFVTHQSNFAEVRRWLAEASKVTLQWQGKAEKAEDSATEEAVRASQALYQVDKYKSHCDTIDRKLKEKEAELEREKKEFASVAMKLSNEQSHLESLDVKRASELESTQKRQGEEHELRLKAERELEAEKEKNKALEASLKKDLGT